MVVRGILNVQLPRLLDGLNSLPSLVASIGHRYLLPIDSRFHQEGYPDFDECVKLRDELYWDEFQ